MLIGLSSSTRASHHARSPRRALGVRGGKTAADLAGAGDKTGADRCRLRRKPSASIAAFGGGDFVVGHAGNQQVLPHGQADIAVAEILRDFRQSAHLCDGDPADRKHDADPVQARPASADARRYGPSGRMAAAARWPRPARASASGRAFPRHAARNFSKPQASSTYLSRALLRLVRSPCSMIDAHHRVGDLRRFFGLTMTPVSRAKSLGR